MKLSRLYSSKPDLFEPVEFVQGLNVVMAEIRLPENRNKDTHNLGKTTLGRLLDFGFLANLRLNMRQIGHFASAVHNQKVIVAAIDEHQIVQNAARIIEQQAVALFIHAQALHIDGHQAF